METNRSTRFFKRSPLFFGAEVSLGAPDGGFLATPGPTEPRFYMRHRSSASDRADPPNFLNFDSSVFKLGRAKETEAISFIDNDITYGSLVVLQHKQSSMLVTLLASEPSHLDEACCTLTMLPREEAGSSAYFRLVPCYKIHSEGDVVCHGDDVVLQLANKPLYIHRSSEGQPLTNLTLRSCLAAGDVTEVNGGDTASPWTLNRYNWGYEELSEKMKQKTTPMEALETGKSMLLLHREQEALLTAFAAHTRHTRQARNERSRTHSATKQQQQGLLTPGGGGILPKSPMGGYSPQSLRSATLRTDSLSSLQNDELRIGTRFVPIASIDASSRPDTPLDGVRCSCNSLWVAEELNPITGGPLIYSRAYRLRHSATGHYLCVVPNTSTYDATYVATALEASGASSNNCTVRMIPAAKVEEEHRATIFTFHPVFDASMPFITTKSFVRVYHPEHGLWLCSAAVDAEAAGMMTAASTMMPTTPVAARSASNQSNALDRSIRQQAVLSASISGAGFGNTIGGGGAVGAGPAISERDRNIHAACSSRLVPMTRASLQDALLLGHVSKTKEAGMSFLSGSIAYLKLFVERFGVLAATPAIPWYDDDMATKVVERTRTALAALIIFCTASDDDDPFTREGLPIVENQQMMFDLNMHRVVMEVLVAPFSGPSKVRDELPPLPLRGGVVNVKTLLNKENEPIHTCCRLSYRLLKQMVKFCPDFGTQLCDYFRYMFAQEGFKLHIADTLNEIFLNNMSIPSHQAQEAARHFIQLIKTKARSAGYVKFLGIMCSDGVRNHAAHQILVSRLFLDECGSFVLPQRLLDYGEVVIEVPGEGNAPERFSTFFTQNKDRKLVKYHEQCMSLFGKVSFNAPQSCRSIVEKHMPLTHVTALMRTFFTDKYALGATTPAVVDSVRASIFDVALNLYVIPFLNQTDQRHRVGRLHLPGSSLKETGRIRCGVADSELVELMKQVSLMMIKSTVECAYVSRERSLMLASMLRFWQEIIQYWQYADEDQRNLLPLLYSLLHPMPESPVDMASALAVASQHYGQASAGTPISDWSPGTAQQQQQQQQQQSSSGSGSADNDDPRFIRSEKSLVVMAFKEIVCNVMCRILENLVHDAADDLLLTVQEAQEKGGGALKLSSLKRFIAIKVADIQQQFSISRLFPLLVEVIRYDSVDLASTAVSLMVGLCSLRLQLTQALVHMQLGSDVTIFDQIYRISEKLRCKDGNFSESLRDLLQLLRPRVEAVSYDQAVSGAASPIVRTSSEGSKSGSGTAASPMRTSSSDSKWSTVTSVMRFVTFKRNASGRRQFIRSTPQGLQVAEMMIHWGIHAALLQKLAMLSPDSPVYVQLMELFHYICLSRRNARELSKYLDRFIPGVSIPDAQYHAMHVVTLMFRSGELDESLDGATLSKFVDVIIKEKATSNPDNSLVSLVTSIVMGDNPKPNNQLALMTLMTGQAAFSCVTELTPSWSSRKLAFNTSLLHLLCSCCFGNSTTRAMAQRILPHYTIMRILWDNQQSIARTHQVPYLRSLTTLYFVHDEESSHEIRRLRKEWTTSPQWWQLITRYYLPFLSDVRAMIVEQHFDELEKAREFAFQGIIGSLGAYFAECFIAGEVRGSGSSGDKVTKNLEIVMRGITTFAEACIGEWKAFTAREWGAVRRLVQALCRVGQTHATTLPLRELLYTINADITVPEIRRFVGSAGGISNDLLFQPNYAPSGTGSWASDGLAATKNDLTMGTKKTSLIGKLLKKETDESITDTTTGKKDSSQPALTAKELVSGATRIQSEQQQSVDRVMAALAETADGGPSFDDMQPFVDLYIVPTNRSAGTRIATSSTDIKFFTAKLLSHLQNLSFSSENTAVVLTGLTATLTQARDTDKLQQLQVFFDQLGLMEVVVYLLDDIDDRLVHCSLNLGIALLYGGNKPVQDHLLNFFSTSTVHFFKVAKDLIVSGVGSAQQLTLQRQQATAFSWMETPHFCKFVHPLFRLLQLMCEGHHLGMQNYMRVQPENLRPVDLTKEIMAFMVEVCSWIDSYSIPLIVQGFALITEMCQGPCHGNQRAFAERNVCSVAMAALTYSVDEGNSASVEELKVAAITTLLSLLEGCNTSYIPSIVMGQVPLKSLDDLLQKAAEDSSQRGAGHHAVALGSLVAAAGGSPSSYYDVGSYSSTAVYYDASIAAPDATKSGTSAAVLAEVQFPIMILLHTLRPLVTEEHRADIEAVLSKHARLSSQLGRIEIERSGRVEAVHFRIPLICASLTDVSKESMLWSVDRSTRSTKLSDFFHKSGELMMEVDLAHQWQSNVTRLTSFGSAAVAGHGAPGACRVKGGSMHRTGGFLRSLRSRIRQLWFRGVAVVSTPNVQPLDNMSLAFAVVTNTLFVFTEGIDRDTESTSTTEAIILALGVLQLLVSFWVFELEREVYHPVHAYRVEADRLRTKEPPPTWRQKHLSRFRTLYRASFIVFSLAGLLVHPYFFAVHLFGLVHKSAVLTNVIVAVTQNARTFSLTAFLGLIIVYLFSIKGYSTFPDHFHEAVENGTTAAAGEGAAAAPTNLDPRTLHSGTGNCATLLQCFIYIFVTGLRQGGGIGDVMREEPWGSPFHWQRLVYDFLFFALINVVFLNILFGIIIDTFAELRDEKKTKELDMTSTCFICGLSSDTFEKEGCGFQEHVRNEHNMWQYLYFMQHLRLKDSTEYTGQESYVADMIAVADLSFFPCGKSLSLGSLAHHGGGGDDSDSDVVGDVDRDDLRLLSGADDGQDPNGVTGGSATQLLSKSGRNHHGSNPRITALNSDVQSLRAAVANIEDMVAQVISRSSGDAVTGTSTVADPNSASPLRMQISKSMMGFSADMAQLDVSLSASMGTLNEGDHGQEGRTESDLQKLAKRLSEAERKAEKQAAIIKSLHQENGLKQRQIEELDQELQTYCTAGHANGSMVGTPTKNMPPTPLGVLKRQHSTLPFPHREDSLVTDTGDTISPGGTYVISPGGGQHPSPSRPRRASIKMPPITASSEAHTPSGEHRPKVISSARSPRKAGSTYTASSGIQHQQQPDSYRLQQGNDNRPVSAHSTDTIQTVTSYSVAQLPTSSETSFRNSSTATSAIAGVGNVSVPSPSITSIRDSSDGSSDAAALRDEVRRLRDENEAIRLAAERQVAGMADECQRILRQGSEFVRELM